MMDRETCLIWLEGAVLSNRYDFVRLLTADWLAEWPQDNDVILFLIQADIYFGQEETAHSRVVEILSRDPLNLEANRWMLKLDPAPSVEQLTSAVLVLPEFGPDSIHREKAADWGSGVLAARENLRQGNFDEALSNAESALVSDPNSPLPILVLIESQMALGDKIAAWTSANAALDRWPDCIYFRALHAESAIAEDEIRGLELLQELVMSDPTGELICRVLGREHSYTNLWPGLIHIEGNRPLPADLAALFGANNLGAANPAEKINTKHIAADTSAATIVTKASSSRTSSEALHETAANGWVLEKETEARQENLPTPEEWEQFQGPDAGNSPLAPSGAELHEAVRAELDRLSSDLSLPARRPDEDLRHPVYIVVSSRTRLMQLHNKERFDEIDQAAQALVDAVRQRRGWTAYRMYIDDPSTLQQFGLTPADPTNPWQIKHRLADLDAILAERSEMIAAVLILGGESVIPFHSLPNPTDDADSVVLSDNPYATADENYFAPEWSVGRFPFDKDAAMLLGQIRLATEFHVEQSRANRSVSKLGLWLRSLLANLFGVRGTAHGYSASVWRKASADVFRAIGEPRRMLTSPPVDSVGLPGSAFRPAQFSYFNLHGLEDFPEWYGQRDPFKDDAVVDYPVALRPDDVINSGRAPDIVFTEACYGANIRGKSVKDALCLKFLASGTHSFIGSTKISYGSVNPPLLAADLLGKLLWRGLKSGLSTGEALRQAKLNLAAEMHKRQGFIDGEDQKAILSFVLYGDPLYTAASVQSKAIPRNIERRKTRPERMQAACALGAETFSEESLDAATREQVGDIVSKYLPGLETSKCDIHAQTRGCDGSDHDCPTHQIGVQPGVDELNKTKVITLSKSLSVENIHHPNYARLTVDENGKVIKLAVSR